MHWIQEVITGKKFVSGKNASIRGKNLLSVYAGGQQNITHGGEKKVVNCSVGYKVCDL